MTRVAREARASTVAGHFSLPNLISLLRIPLAVAFVVSDRTDLRLAILGAAAASDYVDGWIARRYRQGSRAGEILDPLTDKAFVITALATLVHTGALTIAEVLILTARDIVTLLGFAASLVLRLRIRYRSRFSGKVVTTLQLATVIAAIAFPAATRPAVLITGAAAVWAIADYITSGVRALRHAEPQG